MAFSVLGAERIYKDTEGVTKVALPMQYVCDPESDVADLPGVETCTPGSSCVVVATGAMYLMDSTGTWVKQGA